MGLSHRPTGLVPALPALSACQAVQSPYLWSSRGVTASQINSSHISQTSERMKMSPANVCLMLSVALCLWTGPPGAQGWALSKREHIPSDQELMEYINSLRGDGQEYPQEMTDPEYRPKRRSYGSKYDDNKAYGFWISALNKAGNYKRGRRSAPFVPAMSAMEDDRNPFQGDPDYSDMVELVPDHPMDKEVQQ